MYNLLPNYSNSAKLMLQQWPVTQRVGTLGSGGQLIAGTIAKVVKEDGTLAKVDEPGELYVRGKQNALGYYKNEAAYELHHLICIFLLILCLEPARFLSMGTVLTNMSGIT